MDRRPEDAQAPHAATPTMPGLDGADGGGADQGTGAGVADLRPRQMAGTVPVPMAVPHALASVSAVGARYVESFHSLLDSLDLGVVEALVDDLRDVRLRGATVFVAGNGGSAATASHWVNDLSKATRQAGRPWLRVSSLNDNMSWLTAVANDEGYERVFAGQLESLGRAGDLLVVISASGNSPNVVKAIETASAMGIRTWALLGFDGGRVRKMVASTVWLRTPSGAYGLVETGHSLVCDLVTACLAADRLSVDE